MYPLPKSTSFTISSYSYLSMRFVEWCLMWTIYFLYFSRICSWTMLEVTGQYELIALKVIHDLLSKHCILVTVQTLNEFCHSNIFFFNIIHIAEYSSFHSYLLQTKIQVSSSNFTYDILKPLACDMCQGLLCDFHLYPAHKQIKK